MTSVAFAIAFSATTLIPGPAQILSEAMAHYYEAGNVSGTISTTLSEGSVVQRLETRLQFSNPDRFYFNQELVSDSKSRIRAIANGKHFVYPVSAEFNPATNKQGYLVEPLMQNNGEFLNIRGMYAILSKSVVDRSFPLEIAIGRDADLVVIGQLLSNFSDGGVREYNGEDVSVVFCDVLHKVGSEFKLKGAFFINEKRDIRYFKAYGVMKKDDRSRNVEFNAEWIVNLQVNNKEAVKTELYNLDLVNR